MNDALRVLRSLLGQLECEVVAAGCNIASFWPRMGRGAGVTRSPGASPRLPCPVCSSPCLDACGGWSGRESLVHFIRSIRSPVRNALCYPILSFI